MDDRNYSELEVDVTTPPPAFNMPPAAAPVVPGVSGMLPQPVGHVMRPEYLTDGERKNLEAAGWKPGDPIPTDLAKRLSPAIEEIRASARRENLQAPVGSVTQMAVPDEVPLSSLSPERQAEVKAALDQAKVVSAQLEASATTTNPFSSSLNVGSEIELVDDTQGPTADPPPAPGEAAPTAAAAAATGVTGMDLRPEFCPQCNHDLSVSAMEDPSEADRKWYLQAVLGFIKFEKTYTLMAGQLELTFREVEFDTLEAIYQQARQDLMDLPATENDFKEIINRYRVAVQLVRIGMGKTGTTIPKFDISNPAMTLPALSRAVNKRLGNTSLYRIVRMELIQFNRLVAKLEACAARENFWEAAFTT